VTISGPAAVASLFAAATLAVAAAVPEARAQAGVDPGAVKILQRTLDYLAGLKQFSVDTQILFDDMLDSGQKVQFDISAKATVQRPDKMRVQRQDTIVNQGWYYDGKTLTMYDASAKYYATSPAPGSIEQMLDFARESLGIIAPASDLIYRNAFALMMQDVTSASNLGKAMIGGVKCDHLVFSRPDVEFQIWVPDAGNPLPRKYVVTDTGIPAQPEVITLISNWNLAPKPAAGTFSFVPPKGARKTEFMRLDSSSTQ